MRTTIPAQVHPSIAFAIRRLSDDDWLLVINPGMSRADRAYAEALGNHFIDLLLGGWSYDVPEAGIDITVPVDFARVSRVEQAPQYGRIVSHMAAAAVLPLTGLAWMVADAIQAAAPVVGT